MLGATVIDFAELGEVVLVALITSVGVSTLFALAVLGGTRWSERGANASLGAVAYAMLTLVGLLGSLGAVVYGVIALAQK